MNITAKDLVFKSPMAIAFMANSYQKSIQDIDEAKQQDILRYKKQIADKYDLLCSISGEWKYVESETHHTIKSSFDGIGKTELFLIKKVYDQEDCDRTYYRLSVLELFLNGAIYYYKTNTIPSLVLHFGNVEYKIKADNANLVTVFNNILSVYKRKLLLSQSYDTAKQWNECMIELYEYIDNHVCIYNVDRELQKIKEIIKNNTTSSKINKKKLLISLL